jgi:hypothetical protein
VQSILITLWLSIIKPKAPLVNNQEQHIALVQKLEALHAQLQVISGGGFENFSQYSPELQDSFLSGCAQCAGDCLSLLQSSAESIAWCLNSGNLGVTLRKSS